MASALCWGLVVVRAGRMASGVGSWAIDLLIERVFYGLFDRLPQVVCRTKPVPRGAHKLSLSDLPCFPDEDPPNKGDCEAVSAVPRAKPLAGLGGAQEAEERPRFGLPSCTLLVVRLRRCAAPPVSRASAFAHAALL